MREVCGNAALFFDPFDSEDLVDQVESLFVDSALRSSLIERGLAISGHKDGSLAYAEDARRRRGGPPARRNNQLAEISI